MEYEYYLCTDDCMSTDECPQHRIQTRFNSNSHHLIFEIDDGEDVKNIDTAQFFAMIESVKSLEKQDGRFKSFLEHCKLTLKQ